MDRIVGDQNQIGRFGLGQVAGAPGIDLNDLAAEFQLHARVHERRDFDVAAVGGHAVGRRERDRERQDDPPPRGKCAYMRSPSLSRLDSSAVFV